MKVLVTGVAGQLGHDVMNELHRRGCDGVGSDLAPAYSGAADGSPVTQMPYEPLDITDGAAVERVLERVRPDAVIHCAAWTAVDAAEEPENRDKVTAVNAAGTRNIAAVCGRLGCKLAVEGLTDKHFIVRIAWVFGKNGKNFIQTMLRLGQTHDTLRVVDDQIGTPTYTFDLARLLVDMIETDRYGTYHATNEGGYISWAEFAREIFRQAGMDGVTVIPVTTAEYGLSKAARPFNSRLDKSKLTQMGFTPLPDWRDALARYLQEIGNGD